MAEPTAAAESLSSRFTDDDVNENLTALFNTKWNLEIPSELSEASHAFQNLTGMYVALNCPPLMPYIRFDFIGLYALIQRFHRDAFGVQKFDRELMQMAERGDIHPDARATIMKKLPNVGIRINTKSPRKTKIAAAFSLWMMALKPVYLTGTAMQGVPREHLDTLCGSLNFWMAISYLSMFGDVEIEHDADSPIRLARIRYDFTYRSLNLSSLEMLYASIFRKRK